MIKFIIVDIPFKDWIYQFTNDDRFITRCVKTKINKMNLDSYKILPISVAGYHNYNSHVNNIFKNNLDNIDKLENKSKFGKYMLEYFPKHIPTLYYYQFDTERYINTDSPPNKLIQKTNIGSGGVGIEIVYSINTESNDIIISEYIQHIEYYTGHHLVLNGVILDKVYFCSSQLYENGIRKGRIINYTISHELPAEDTIFYNIFKNLNYSGFANSDFIIKDNNIIIFEINPRPGGSLIYNKEYFNKFIDTLSKEIKF